MSFVLNNIGRIPLPDLGRQFSPFLNGEKRLPCCVYNFLLNEASFIPPKQEKQINEMHFAASPVSENGVVISNERLCVHTYHDFSVSDVWIPSGYYAQKEILSLMMHAYKYTMIWNGGLSMHSAVVSYQGQGVAFCGLSGAGKSTQAHLWEQYRLAQAINLDQPCVLFSGSQAYISGSPWSGKEDCYKNVSVPLRAIVYVEQADTNAVEKLSAAEAFSLLYLHNALYAVNPAVEKSYTAVIEKIISSVPVYRLYCTVSEDAVNVLSRVLFGK